MRINFIFMHKYIQFLFVKNTSLKLGKLVKKEGVQRSGVQNRE